MGLAAARLTLPPSALIVATFLKIVQEVSQHAHRQKTKGPRIPGEKEKFTGDFGRRSRGQEVRARGDRPQERYPAGTVVTPPFCCLQARHDHDVAAAA